MKGLIWLLAAFSLAVGLSLVTRYGEGYVLIAFPPWRVEFSLAFAVLLLTSGFVAGYALVRLVSHTLRLPAHVRAFRERQRETKGRAALADAMQALFEGRYARAQKLAARAYELGITPLVAALVAARAAHRLRDTGERDAWLARADVGFETRHARLVTEAELLLDERRYEAARSVLRKLHESGPRSIASLQMLLRAEQGTQNWDEVLRLARILEKRDAAPREWLRQLRLAAINEGLRARAFDVGNLSRQWKGLDELERLDHRVAGTAARLFIRLSNGKAAHDILREALDHEWSGDSAALYGECFGADAREQLEHAERWFRDRPRDPALLRTLGRLCAHLELWGKAQSYLETSLAIQESREAHVALARLAERLERPVEAMRHYRAAAESGLTT